MLPAEGIAQPRSRDRIFLYACELAAMWRSVLAEGSAAGITAIAVDQTASAEVLKEHEGRLLDSAAAIPAACEILHQQTGRQVELVFPVAIDADSLGWGVRYASEETGS